MNRHLFGQAGSFETVALQIQANLSEHFVERLDLAAVQSGHAECKDFGRHRPKFAFQFSPARGQKYVDLAAIGLIVNALDQAGTLHRIERRHHGWGIDSNAFPKLALCHAIFIPQHAQHEPHTDGNAFAGDAWLQAAGKRTPDLADNESDAIPRGNVIIKMATARPLDGRSFR